MRMIFGLFFILLNSLADIFWDEGLHLTEPYIGIIIFCLIDFVIDVFTIEEWGKAMLTS